MPISSLPSPHGIGTMGKAAYDFADFLAAAGQKYWQLGPTSYGDSPYQSFSSFAGNPYFIDLDLLIKDKLLTRAEVNSCDWGDDPRYVDYGKIYESRFALLEKAKARGFARDHEDIAAFEKKNERWLPDYALFMALKRHFGMKAWTEWDDEDIRCRKDSAVIERYRGMLRDDVELFTYIQFLFFRQWTALKDYIHSLGIRIIGDLPIYVAMDSADVWAEPEMFQLDEHNVPVEVSGVPPDCFSADGQLWGNPLYNYEAMARDGYGWWIRRVGGAQQLYDVIRIDHFRGFDSYYCIPYGAKNAKRGVWRKGPGMHLWNAVRRRLGDLPVIAEDLGFMTDSVRQMVADSGFPNMKVLQFAFDAAGESDHLPHAYHHNSVVYTGTHDNDTIRGWIGETKEADLAFAMDYLQAADEEQLPAQMMRAAMASVCDICILTMQDLLGLGAEARMNTPSTVGENWRWRARAEQITPEIADRLAELTRLYGRAPAAAHKEDDHE